MWVTATMQNMYSNFIFSWSSNLSTMINSWNYRIHNYFMFYHVSIHLGFSKYSSIIFYTERPRVVRLSRTVEFLKTLIQTAVSWSTRFDPIAFSDQWDTSLNFSFNFISGSRCTWVWNFVCRLHAYWVVQKFSNMSDL